MHKLTSFCLVVLSVLVASDAVAQFGGFDYPGQQYYFRSGISSPAPYSSFSGYGGEQRQYFQNPEARFFFTTLTLTLTTTTSTSTFTSSTTCTTSTATLTTCQAGRRRREALLVGRKDPRGLLHDEEAVEESIFISSPAKVEEEPAPVQEPARQTREVQPIPFVVQPGFRSTESIPVPRFLLAFGTSTTTTTTTSTYTSTLTATCSSTTSYSTCGSSGK